MSGRLRLKPLHEQPSVAVEADERNDTAALAKLERAAPSPGRTPVGRSRTVIRQGALPGGDVCAHPFRDDDGKCRVCGHPW